MRERVEAYLDIGENDVFALESEISKLVSWHRAEMLPQYAVFLEIQAQLAEGLGWNRAQIDEMIRVLRVMIKDTSQGSAIYIANVLVNHTSKPKVDHIQAAMVTILSNHRELHDEPLADQIDAAGDKAVTNFERFFGTLTDYQIAIIREHKMQMYDPTGDGLIGEINASRTLSASCEPSR